jgi:translation initiation factor 1
MRKPGPGGLVYSTDGGRMCPVCRQSIATCTCRASPAAPAGDGIIRVGLSTKGRGGKAVTVADGFGATLDAQALAALGKRLRSACGAGGTVKDGCLEVQGDHVERVVTFLQAEGWGVKRASSRRRG